MGSAGARRGSRVAWAVALIGLSGGSCLPGYNDEPPGEVHPEQLCVAEAPDAGATGCPVCSTDDGDARGPCQDRWYQAGRRCRSEGDGRCEGGGGACRDGFCVFDDRDGNGVDDALDEEVARRNLPRLLFHPDESCGGPNAIVYHVRHHPAAPRRLAVTYVILYNRDCGAANGHLGDSEALGVTVDLDAQPGPAATVGVVTLAHRNTPCQSESTCQARPGTGACAAPGSDQVVVYVSRDKHGNYFSLDACAWDCLEQCSSSGPALEQRLLDVGGPLKPLSRDLTANGLIRGQDGWDPLLLHFDPWSSMTFGDGGHVRDQLMQVLAPAGR